MIQANGLRIGNYYNHNGDYKKVNVNVIEELEISDRLWIKPIELTEEILLKCENITKTNGYPYKMLNGFIKIRNGVFFFKYYDLEIELPYLHTLQNIYFALIGQELQINL